MKLSFNLKDFASLYFGKTWLASEPSSRMSYPDRKGSLDIQFENDAEPPEESLTPISGVRRSDWIAFEPFRCCKGVPRRTNSILSLIIIVVKFWSRNLSI